MARLAALALAERRPLQAITKPGIGSERLNPSRSGVHRVTPASPWLQGAEIHCRILNSQLLT